MKKSFLFCLVVAFVLLLAGGVYAAGLDSWKNLPGFLVNGKKSPAQLNLTKDGLKVVLPKGYYTDDGNYSGVIYNNPVDTGKLSVEFTINKVAGYGIDTWIGLHLFNKPEYFSVSNPKQSQGFVTLIRPTSEDNVQFQVMEHVDSFAWKIGKDLGQAPEAAYLFELVKTDDGYAYSINGEEIVTLYGLTDVFASGKGYFSMGGSTNNDESIILTINRINGKPVAEL